MATPLVSTDPSDLANAATCWSSCVPIGLHMSLKTKQLNDTAIIVTNPVCSTPAAPSISQAKTTSDNSVQIIWKANPHNTGSFVTGWIVSWGTTPGGPYPNNSGVLPLVPRIFVVTGLNSGTTYYFIVTAVTSISGCTSNSPQASATTTGSAPSNGLLTNLVSHWALESNAGTDDKDANTLSETGGVSHPAGGIIGNYCRVNGVGVGTYLLNCPPNLQAGPGVSFTFQIWVQWFADSVPVAANAFASATQVWLLAIGAASDIGWTCWDSVGAAHSFATGFTIPHAGWHQFVVGYDAVNKLQFAQMDNAARVTNAMPSDTRASNGIFVLGAGGSAVPDNIGIDEAAYWTGVLTTAQVTALWNGGAGLPFASYQP